MANENGIWFEVIGKALAYLCIQQISQNDPKRVADIPAKAKFLEDLGPPADHAAKLLGTTTNSIKTNLRTRGKKEIGNGKKGNNGRKR